MNNNRLILIISILFPLLVSLPRIVFLLSGKNDPTLNNLFEVTIEDIIFRFLLLFGFTFTVLKFNLVWIYQIKATPKKWLSVGINALILIVWLVIFQLISKYIYDIHASVLSPRINAIVYGFFLLILNLISYAIKLINTSKQDKIEKQILKQKSLENELNALKNQINPHFLFNSLNTLSLLVREDQKAAGKFINKLSFLFRYIIQSQHQSLVTVKEELKVLDSYTHLIKQRYQDNLGVTINIADELLRKEIPVLALQMLMENAIKHNEISNQNPLTVELYSDGKWIVVKNTLQLRTGNIESTNTGLKNLSMRTKLQMNQDIEIIKSDTHFIVKLPTL